MEKKPRKTALIVICTFLGVLALAAGITVLYLYSQYRYLGENPLSAFRNNSCAPSTPKKTITPEATHEPGPTATPVRTAMTGEINVMLIGLDSSAERDELDMGARNDTNIIINADFDKKTVKMLAIPRDTIVDMQRVDSSGKASSPFKNRINTAFHYGGGADDYGYQNVMDRASHFLSCNGKYEIPIDYYLSINIDGIVPICDAVGGVPLTLDSDFPGLGWKAGQTVIIQGDVAQMYLRWRHPEEVGNHTGDIGRGRRQELFLIALAKKIKSMGPVETVEKLYESMQRYMNTNMSLEQIVAMGQALENINLNDIKVDSIEGRNLNSTWIPDLKKLPKTVEQIFFN